MVPLHNKSGNAVLKVDLPYNRNLVNRCNLVVTGIEMRNQSNCCSGFHEAILGLFIDRFKELQPVFLVELKYDLLLLLFLQSESYKVEPQLQQEGRHL